MCVWLVFLPVGMVKASKIVAVAVDGGFAVELCVDADSKEKKCNKPVHFVVVVVVVNVGGGEDVLYNVCL